MNEMDFRVTSNDGTTIAYDRKGSGPAVVLVGGALDDGAENAPLVPALAEHFTVYNYARRGRGASGFTASGSGDINDSSVNLPAGGSVTYTVHATVAASATGTLDNTATVTAPSANPYRKATPAIPGADTSVFKPCFSRLRAGFMNLSLSARSSEAHCKSLSAICAARDICFIPQKGWCDLSPAPDRQI